MKSYTRVTVDLTDVYAEEDVQFYKDNGYEVVSYSRFKMTLEKRLK